MTIKEKLMSLGLGPNQSAEILYLLTQAYVNGFIHSADMAGSEFNHAIVADLGLKVGDCPYTDFGGVPDLKNFSKVYGVDLTNDIP